MQTEDTPPSSSGQWKKPFDEREWEHEKYVYLLPISFECPHCKQQVKSTVEDGSRVACSCIEVTYDGRRFDVIPSPADIIPRWIDGAEVDYPDIEEETRLPLGPPGRAQKGIGNGGTMK